MGVLSALAIIISLPGLARRASPYGGHDYALYLFCVREAFTFSVMAFYAPHI